MKSLAGKRVVVFGLAKSGLSAIQLLLREGAEVTALDARSRSELGELAPSLEGRGVRLMLGPTPGDFLPRFELIVVSPGVPLALPELVDARAQGVEVIGEVELAARLLPPTSRFVGITGTNGKSTTTALTGELFRAAGLRTFVGGNLGLPLSEAVMSEEAFGVHVVELSSFQLEGITSVRVHAGALLNLQPDHIDRYPSQREYGAAKARIFAHQSEEDVAVVNLDDEVALSLAAPTRGQLHGFSLKAPAGRTGMFATAEGFQWLRNAGAPERYSLRNRALRGAHNCANAMAATLLARLSGVSPDAVQAGLDAYPGLAHRLESVATLDGVEWINDSKATNVDSSLVALAAFPKNVWLIAGGKGKGAPYEPLVAASRDRVKGVLTIGADAPTLARAFEGSVPVTDCGTLEAAVQEARKQAQPGDVVLLSPACASYDQFKNFEDRGDAFKRWVRALA